MYTNKKGLALLFCIMLNISSTFARPVPEPEPDDDGDDTDISVGIDAGRIATYFDGSFMDKYNDTLEGYDSQYKHDCRSKGCSHDRSSSIGSDALGHTSNSNLVLGVGHEHENQTIYGAEVTHNGDIAISEVNIKYGGELGLGASYDETNLGGSIGYKYGASGSVGALGVDVGAGIGFGLGADVGYNSHEKSVALVATTPAGEYGVKVGCKSQFCYVACISVDLSYFCQKISQGTV